MCYAHTYLELGLVTAIGILSKLTMSNIFSSNRCHYAKGIRLLTCEFSVYWNHFSLAQVLSISIQQAGQYCCINAVRYVGKTFLSISIATTIHMHHRFTSLSRS